MGKLIRFVFEARDKHVVQCRISLHFREANISSEIGVVRFSIP